MSTKSCQHVSVCVQFCVLQIQSFSVAAAFAAGALSSQRFVVTAISVMWVYNLFITKL